MVLIFIILLLVGVTLIETSHEKGCFKVIHIYNKQMIKCISFLKIEVFYYATAVCWADHM